MNSQIQIKLTTIIIILLIVSTLSPIRILSTIINIHLVMYSSATSSFSFDSTLPGTYVSSKIEKAQSFIESLLSKSNKVNSKPLKHIPVVIPSRLSKAQKEAALPFLTIEPPKKSSRSKSIGNLFKKIARATPVNDCFNARSTEDMRKTHYKLTFVPIVKMKNATFGRSSGGVTEIVWSDSDTASECEESEKTVETTTAEEYAQRIWDEDETVYENLELVVEWIGNGEPSGNAILQSYMAHFDFTDVELEQAFRSLCSKLHFKGETQQIDRVLLEFSTRYFECNPDCVLKSIDVIHVIVYSLLLLNTDLHVAKGGHKKMTQSAFVKNIMYTIVGESALRSLSMQSLDSLPMQRSLSAESNYSVFKHLQESHPVSSLHALATKSWQSDLRDILKQMYNNIRSCQLTNAALPPSSTLPVENIIKRSTGSINWTAESWLNQARSITSDVAQTISPIAHYQNIASQLETFDTPSVYKSNAPYYKEGMIYCKHVLENSERKAKHRDWRECFVVIECSQLRIYKLNKRNGSIGDGDWISTAELMGGIDLKHSLATTLPSGHSQERPFAFRLQQSNGAVDIFQGLTSVQVEEWVNTCNYWAARGSKEPLIGGITSLEYGWGKCLETDFAVMIYDWQPPTCPPISSELEEFEQLVALYKHVRELSKQLDQHRDIKLKMESHAALDNKAFHNWKKKNEYLLHEIIKYQNYCNSIEKSIALQASLQNVSSM